MNHHCCRCALAFCVANVLAVSTSGTTNSAIRFAKSSSLRSAYADVICNEDNEPTVRFTLKTGLCVSQGSRHSQVFSWLPCESPSFPRNDSSSGPLEYSAAAWLYGNCGLFTLSFTPRSSSSRHTRYRCYQHISLAAVSCRAGPSAPVFRDVCYYRFIQCSYRYWEQSVYC